MAVVLRILTGLLVRALWHGLMQVMFTAKSRIVLYNEGAVIVVGGLLNMSTYGFYYIFVLYTSRVGPLIS